MNYLHLTHQQDNGAMLHWLFVNSDILRAGGNLQHAHQATHESSAGHGHPQLTPEFVPLANFHKPELFAHSCLLTITIIVSVLTAWIAMRKPAAEQGAGHGHH